MPIPYKKVALFSGVLPVFFLFTPIAFAATDLYVATTGSDTNPGTQSAPFQTIQKAGSVVAAGGTVHVASGTYTGNLTTSVSGTASAPIRFVSDTKWGAKIIPPNSTGDATAWSVSGSYITIDGFDVDGQSTLGWRNGIYMSGSHDTVQNTHVHHIGNASACDNTGGAGIGMDGYFGGSFHDVIGNVTDHIGPSGCTYYHGIYMASFDYTVKNNMSYQNTGTGIHSNHDSGRGYIVNNTIFGNARVGILCEGNDFRNVTVAGPFVIENNLVYDNYPTGTPGAGNIGGIGIVGTVVSTNIIANNYAYQNRDLDIYMPSGKGTVSGNITTGLPGLVNYQVSGTGDYHLAAGSQLIDKGLATYAPTTDIDGNTRPQGAGYDIGAYEYGATPPPPPPPPASLTINSTQFTSSSTITLTVNDPGAATDDWVALYVASDPDSAYSYQENWMYLNGTKTAPASPITSTTLQFIAPNTPGTYNIRLFRNAGYANRLTVTPNFTVSSSAPLISLSSSSLNFGSVVVGTPSATQALTITNTGSAALMITSGFTFTGDFSGSGNCYVNTPINPGANCVVNIQFTPTTTGTRTGTLTITDNAAGSPHTVALSGTGVSTADTQAPTVPTNLSATSFSSSTMHLSWTASTDNVGVAGYKIFRGGVQIATVTGATTYDDTGLAPSTTYTYTVAAYDAAGNTSAQSTAATTTTQSATGSKFVIGDRVHVSSGPLNVRRSPSTSSKILGTQPTGAMGKVISGPTVASGYTWWKVNYDTGADGWSVENYLEK